ncbi:MAG TPA: efflux transporter outer membrane subunit [Janthinobacterium sp.]|jgi:NodT family efflux transporter outer membrane factor (OMF) lipoprotein|nr:efflux transporter outer membrane subunit [Janthinobacterium sp.]
MKPSSFYRHGQRLLMVAAAAALCACSTLPEYAKPAVDLPAHFTGAPGWAVAEPGDQQPRGAWWSIFQDEELNRLEAQVDISSQTVRKALAQLQQARAQVDYQQAGFFPTVSANVSSIPFRTSANRAGSSLAGKTVPDHSLGLNASWEPDLFGRIQDAVTTAQGYAQASEADLQAVRLSVGSDLALNYFQLRSLENQKMLLDRTVKAYAAALDILQQQLQNGAIDASAVAQARTQLESARAQDSDIDSQRAMLLHAIATLIGQPASTFTLAPTGIAKTPPVIPPALPSQLLQRRPDIAAAERRVAAANAQIGQAHAAFFPALQLTGAVGLESTYLAPWLSAPSLFWAIGPQLVGTVFDGGQRKAMLANATAQYDGAVADYRQTVLQSLQQVEDSLSDLHTLANEKEHQDLATSSAALALQLTSNRFQAGAVSYLDVVTAQTIALQNERLDEQLSARRLASSVLLIKALGGGWQGLGAQYAQ